MVYVRKRLVADEPIDVLYERSTEVHRKIAELSGERQREEQWVKDQLRADPAWREMNYAQQTEAMRKAFKRHTAEFNYEARYLELEEERERVWKAIQRHPDSGADVRVRLTQGELLRLHEAFKRAVPGEEVDIEGLLQAVVRGWMKERGI